MYMELVKLWTFIMQHFMLMLLNSCRHYCLVVQLGDWHPFYTVTTSAVFYQQARKLNASLMLVTSSTRKFDRSSSLYMLMNVTIVLWTIIASDRKDISGAASVKSLYTDVVNLHVCWERLIPCWSIYSIKGYTCSHLVCDFSGVGQELAAFLHFKANTKHGEKHSTLAY